MSELVYWPGPPPKDAVVLVRATGTETIEGVRNALRGKIQYVEAGYRKDDITFYVRGSDRAEAKRLVQEAIA